MNIPCEDQVVAVFPTKKSMWVQSVRHQLVAVRTQPVEGRAWPTVTTVYHFLRWQAPALGHPGPGEVTVPSPGMHPALCQCLPWAHPTWHPVGLALGGALEL